MPYNPAESTGYGGNQIPRRTPDAVLVNIKLHASPTSALPYNTDESDGYEKIVLRRALKRRDSAVVNVHACHSDSISLIMLVI